LPKNEHETRAHPFFTASFRTAQLLPSPENRSSLLGFRHLPGRQNRKTAHSGRAINLEVTPVKGENPAQPLSLGNAYQCRIREIHRQITVFAHQLSHTGDIVTPERQYLDSAGLNHLPESILAFP